MVSKICSLIGAALLVAALAIWVSNLWEDRQAGEASADRLSQLVAQIPEQKEPAPEFEILDAPQSHAEPVDVTMKEVDMNGTSYIGYLTIPKLKLELPIISQWTYDDLTIAPCRYYGTMKGEDLVLLAHNYGQHFGKINQLNRGDEITFTDMEGTVYTYEVAAHETLSPMEVDTMIESHYALTLFTCSYDSESRIVVRCIRVRE